MGEEEVSNYLTYLAVDRKVTSSTQNLALCSIVFMYKHVLKRDLTLLTSTIRAKAPTIIPTVLSNDEAMTIINELKHPHHLIFSLLYGNGLRKAELLRLRVKNIDFTENSIYVFRGKGAKDRMTLLPYSLIEPLKDQIATVVDDDTGNGIDLTSSNQARNRLLIRYVFEQVSQLRIPFIRDNFFVRG